MNQTKFTPGPWRVSHDYHTQVVTQSEAIKKGGLVVCEAFGKHAEETDANARLISKAPEMFEALKQALNVLEKSVHFETSLPFWKKGGDGYQAMIETRSLLNSIQDGGGK